MYCAVTVGNNANPPNGPIISIGDVKVNVGAKKVWTINNLSCGHVDCQKQSVARVRSGKAERSRSIRSTYQVLRSMKGKMMAQVNSRFDQKPTPPTTG